ncbi:MAG: menaquinone-dependent protoporphyrinogen IX dehydrogenase [Neisseriales bacterium]|nr:MAG: menaquinone-dependent protoporphyrinogen IX dehydrogenase [Neisseriales bacterium]
MKILLLYSTYDGHTREIANKVAAQLKRVGCAFDLFDFNQLPTIVLADYNAVLIAAAIRYGHFHESVIQFVKTHRILLNTKLTAFLGVCLVARKPNRQLPDHNIYLKKFLRRTKWHPTLCEAVAGALRYPRYTWLDKQLIRCMMWFTGGETNTNKEVVYTNWQQVERLVDTLVQALKKNSITSVV